MSDAMTPGNDASAGLPGGEGDVETKLEPKITSHPMLIAGCIAATIPFFIHVSQSSTTTENGVVVASRYIDYIAVIGGASASFFGAMLLIHALSRKTQKAEGMTVAFLIDALGIYHLLHGLGIFH